MTARAERGISAPPEVVFNTATDPNRVSAWLPAPLRGDGVPGAELVAAELRARWRTAGTPNWSARLQVSAIDAGGATVRLELEADPPERRLPEIADESLASLAREVADNLSAS
ncbi:hypothetical protein I0C86_26115 [Plantactinospora sp. S1510]|uniref:Polyketide cyclase / dehydrase and lipid transport n=1 Tax=Plantactinospora alkalitolerans TaxID=2789879 RepID=A0ABS0H2E9_9ACTN|nr:hypothetical protein [Plantactinospora alkalitolerans]MBF9132398.1 hypothetical protein [Plantactinospora alkalitolerans]